MSLKLKYVSPAHTGSKRTNGQKKKFHLLVIAVLVSVALCSGCTGKDISQTPDTDSVKNLTIACTIPPQEEFIRAIGGESVNVLVMVPPGASPHTFEPTPTHISGLETADLYMTLGSGIEFENRWISRIAEMFPHLPLVNSSERIQLRKGTGHHHEDESPGSDEESSDPHIWLSIRNSAEIVNITCDALTELRPSQKDAFEKNRDLYLTRLFELDTQIQNTLADIPTRTILVYHPAFGYFCQDYNLTQIAVEEGGQEPSARSLAALIEKARDEHITLVFSEPEFSTQGAETLAAEIHGTMVLISPLSGEYLKNMQYIADSIAGK
jgi:zinc transport system substrate-binding protein